MSLTTALVSTLGLAGATLVLATRREARAARTHPPTGEDVEVEGIRIPAEVMGTGPDLVMIHGSSGNLRDFSHTMAPILAGRYRVILFDRPGLGWSDPHPEGGDITAQARILQKAAAALGAARPIVLGQSYGGTVALAWATTLPDTLSAVVPVAAPAFPWRGGIGWYYAVTSHPLGLVLAIPLIPAFVPDWYVRREIEAVFAPQPAPADYADHFGPDLTVRRRALRENARQRRHLNEQIGALAPGYHTIKVPVELVHGDADPIVGVWHSKRFAADYPGANLTLLPGIGHMPHHVAQPDVIAAIDRAASRANC
jgi:pimeloyl-ACP methyl ester carboxylesterase